MRNLKSTLLLGGLTLLLLSGCAAETPEESTAEVPRNVRVLELAAASINEYVEVSGPVAPVRGTDLSAEESGPVRGLPVAKGAAVAAGEMVVELEREILHAEMEAAAAALEAEAFNADKVRQLHDAKKVSQRELLAANSALAAADARLRVALERHQRAGIKAPFAGVVTDRYVELGQLVAPGMPVVRVIDPYTLKLEAYLTDSQVRWIAAGDAATVLLGEAATTAPGTVSWVGFEADRLTGKFKVEIEIPNENLRLRSGVIGRARLQKDRQRDVVLIPRDAVVSGRTGPEAYVVEDNRAVPRQLELGAAQGLMVVVNAGLVPGDRLVVRGQRELRDGSLVKVTEEATYADGSTASDPGQVTRAATGTRISDTDAAGDGTDVEAGR